MDVIPTNYPVADYCQSLKRGELQVNRKYQRSDKVWPAAARSFLIETIILGYPVPKISLFQRLDLKSKTTFKEIVDGQQRSKAILDFFDGKLRLSQTVDTEELRGKTFERIDEDFQERFLNYSLAADVFVAATPETIREVFRRTNSYTVPLNPEEERHATFQGPFKWFIYRLSRENNETLSKTGTFSEKSFVRMTDTKLFAEISHALMYGISTTDKSKLRKLYRDHEQNFPSQRDFTARFRKAFGFLREWEELHGTVLAKPFMLYSLILALMHLSKPCQQLQESYSVSRPRRLQKASAVNGLLLLAEAFEQFQELDEEAERDFPYLEFCRAAEKRTNVKDQRAKRFEWFCRAMEGNLPKT